MIAIYARQSVDRADSISIEQQVELCRYETRGEVHRTYIDRGYSGRNTNRPQFTNMMSDIRSGLIRTVIVYKLDRISRSILDFSKMMEVFGSFGVKFISATEKFDTSSPMGNAMLNICIVFAQLERETIQKRVADAYYSRSRKSFYMGGAIPYGFRKVPAVIDGVRTSMYDPVPEEAETVRLIYEMYSQPETSYGDISSYLNGHGVKKRGRDWIPARIRDILINPIYVKADETVYGFFVSGGAEVENPLTDFIGENGCYSYRGQSGRRKSSVTVAGERIILAPHKGIVEPDVWLKCRSRCLEQKQFALVQKAKNSWLCGKIKCGKCGYALMAKRYSDRPHRYLICSGRQSTKGCAGAGTLYTDEIEELVQREIRRKLSCFGKLSRRKENVPDAEQSALMKELAETDREIRGLMERLGSSDEALFRYINDRVGMLDRRRAEISGRIAELERKKLSAPDETDCHLTMWEELSFDDKRQVADALIKVIYATEKRVTIVWKL